MTRYGQFCPVSKAMELLDERWTMLVIRELLLGSRRFNELRRGVPRMSPALLSARLRTLVRAGLVERHEAAGRTSYTLTEAGQELRPIVVALGEWGTRWVPEIGDTDLDPHLLMWDMHRNIDLDAVPTERTVLRFTFTDVPGRARDWWLVINADGVDLCDADPGHAVAATVQTDLRTMTEIWRGDRDWSATLRSGALAVRGPAPVARALPRWLKLSLFAHVPRPARAG